MSPILDTKGLVYVSQSNDGVGADFGVQALLTETEKLLESWKHPDPYTPPTAPGGKIYQPLDPENPIQATNTILQVPSLSETSLLPFSIVSICPADPSHVQLGN